MNQHELRGRAALYLLGLLTPEDAREFTGWCQELEEMSTVMAAIAVALSRPAVPPEGLRRRLLARLAPGHLQ